MLKFFNSEKGFTLIELLVVIAILAIIGGFAAPQLIGVLTKAKADSKDGDVAIVQSAVDRYVLDKEATGMDSSAILADLRMGTGTGTQPQRIDFSKLTSGNYLKKIPAGSDSYIVDANLKVVKN